MCLIFVSYSYIFAKRIDVVAPGSHYYPSPSLDATKEEDMRRSRRPASRRSRRRVPPVGRSWWRDPPRLRAVAMMPKESSASSNARANGSTRISRFVIVCAAVGDPCKEGGGS